MDHKKVEKKVSYLYKESPDGLSLVYLLNNGISWENVKKLLERGILEVVPNYKNVGNYNYYTITYALTKYYKRLMLLEEIENG